jgi:hypothetical protein
LYDAHDGVPALTVDFGFIGDGIEREGKAIALGAEIPSGPKTNTPLAALPLARRSY